MLNFMSQLSLCHINNNIKFLENIKQGFKRTISWKNYRSEIATQTKSINFDYLIDPIFRRINRLFELSFKHGDHDPTRCFFDEYYMQLVEVSRYFNALIENEPFFWSTSKKQRRSVWKTVKMLRNDDYTTEDLLGFSFHKSYYILIGTDLPRQANTNIAQQINFTGRLEEDDGATIFFISEKQQKTIVNFSLDSFIVTELYK